MTCLCGAPALFDQPWVPLWLLFLLGAGSLLLGVLGGVLGGKRGSTLVLFLVAVWPWRLRPC